MTLTRRLLASYLAIIGATALILTVAADRLLRHRLTDAARAELALQAGALADAAARHPADSLHELVARLARLSGRRMTVVDRAGTVIADSDVPVSMLASIENHADRPEFRAALSGGTGSDQRLSETTGRNELKVAVPYPGGAVRVSSPLEQVDAVVGQAQGAVLAGALGAVLLASLLALGFAVNVARPLTGLRDAARAISRGERPAFDIRGRHEVGELARALKTLDENLGARLAELERERSETAALIGSMVEGVIACDARGMVTTMNPAARRLLDLGPDDPLPAAGELFLHRAAREAFTGAMAGDTTSGVEVELGARTVLLSAHDLAHGGAVVVLHDVTALKRLEAVRRDFVANVSHELKTPLSVVRGAAETLLGDDPPAPLRTQFLESMLRNAHRMQRLIDDLLDLSRIESGGWEPRPATVALEPLAREVWAGLDGGRAARVAFATAIGADAAQVRADPDALRQVLSNVLDNALRHTGDGGTITVRSRRDDGGVVLEVADTGEGIPSEHLPRIFERFYRVDAGRSREAGGTGLGLAIVKHMVEAHGGRVVADSVLGHGTTIRMTFPSGADAG